jgi:hypothetical protein
MENSEMSHPLASDDRRLSAHLARIKVRPVRSRTAHSRANGFFAAVIEAIAAAKLRRPDREFALRGVSYPCPERDRTLHK